MFWLFLEKLVFERKKGRLGLTDVVMPGMNGGELARAIKKFQPTIKVLFMSEYTDNVVTKKGILKPGISFINKPLVPSKLTKMIQKVLHSSSP